MSDRIQTYGTRWGYTDMEDKLHDMYDGKTPVLMVEVFDHPDATTVDGEARGVWVLGPLAEVRTWLIEHNHTDYAEQYELGGVHE